MSDVAIVVPLWRRTVNLPRLWGSICATCPTARTVFVCSPEDNDTINALDDRGFLDQPSRSSLLVVDWPGGGGGDYARKINAGFRASGEPFIFTGADDLEFTDGWWEAASAVARFSEVTPGVVGTVDDCNPRTADGSHSTHSLVARWYAEMGGVIGKPRTIYCEQYDHDYCDDELVGTARARGLYAHAYGAVVRHHHPMAGRAADDETYQRGRSRSRQSATIYRRRQRLWQRAAT
jgi:hypothetical protein